MATVEVRVPVDHPAFAGHFPGQPLWPGVLLLAEVMEAALADPSLAEVLGPAPRIANAKFLAPVRPGDELTLQLVANGKRLSFEVTCRGQTAASGQFEASQQEGPPP